MLIAWYITTGITSDEDLGNNVLLFYPGEEGTWKRLLQNKVRVKIAFSDAG